mmetsp:Transcript_100304/g.266626  ORF Transcript_100304/g.266626 Transcript_100304/m.266626 type:complete len:375 (-) Transcript_100304:71-1195(-)
MAATSMKALALLEVFLLLSMNPINAYRAHDVEGMVEGLEGTHRVLKEELERALHEDAHGSDYAQAVNDTHGYIGESWASCDQRKEDFERRAVKVKARYDEAMEDGSMDAAEAVWVILKARKLTTTLQSAQGNDCAWANRKESAEVIDKSPLEALLAETGPKQPCFGAAKKTLEDAKGADAEGQKAAFLQAMGTLLSQSGECKTIEAEKPSEGEVAGRLQEEAATNAEEDAEAVEVAYSAGQFEKEKLRTAKRMQEVMKMDDKYVGDWLQTGELVSARHDFGGMVAHLLGWLILAILWILVCWVLATVVLLVLALILCTLKVIIGAFIRLFGGSAWDLDWSGCATWWLGAIGHSDRTTGGLGVAICAANMMKGNR